MRFEHLSGETESMKKYITILILLLSATCFAQEQVKGISKTTTYSGTRGWRTVTTVTVLTALEDGVRITGIVDPGDSLYNSFLLMKGDTLRIMQSCSTSPPGGSQLPWDMVKVDESRVIGFAVTGQLIQVTIEGCTRLPVGGGLELFGYRYKGEFYDIEFEEVIEINELFDSEPYPDFYGTQKGTVNNSQIGLSR